MEQKLGDISQLDLEPNRLFKVIKRWGAFPHKDGVDCLNKDMTKKLRSRGAKGAAAAADPVRCPARSPGIPYLS